MANYAGACHRAALCADPLGSNPPYALAPIILPEAQPPTVSKKGTALLEIYVGRNGITSPSKASIKSLPKRD